MVLKIASPNRYLSTHFVFVCGLLMSLRSLTEKYVSKNSNHQTCVSESRRMKTSLWKRRTSPHSSFLVNNVFQIGLFSCPASLSSSSRIATIYDKIRLSRNFFVICLIPFYEDYKNGKWNLSQVVVIFLHWLNNNHRSCLFSIAFEYLRTRVTVWNKRKSV